MGPQSGYVSNNQEDFKVDWTPGDKNKIAGFYSQGKGSDYTTAIIPVDFPNFNTYPTKIAGASFVHTFSPTIVNEARFGFTRVRWNNGVPSDPTGQFGYTGDSKVGIPFGTQLYVGFTGQSISNGASYLGTNANPQVFTDNTFNYEDNLTWQRGQAFPFDWRTSHAISAELSQRRERRIPRAIQLQRPIHRPAWRIRLGCGRLRARPDFQCSAGLPSWIRRQSPVAIGTLFPGRFQGDLQADLESWHSVRIRPTLV